MSRHRHAEIAIALLGTLACNRSPLPGDTHNDSDCPKPIEPQSKSCGDQEFRAGEFCQSPGQAIELMDSMGAPRVVRAELVVADFNADDRLDLLTGQATALGDGQGNFDIIEIPRAISNPQTGEFDGKPGVDVVYMYNIDANSDGVPYGRISFILGGPDYPNIDTDVGGNQFGGPDQEQAVTLVDLAVGDFDGDGSDDIAVHSVVDDFDIDINQLWMLTHDGSFSFDAQLLASTSEGDFLPIVSAGRLNADSLDDLVWGARDVILGGSPSPSHAFDIYAEFGFTVIAHSKIGVARDCADVLDSLMPAAGQVFVLHGNKSSPSDLSVSDDEISVGGQSMTSLEPWDVADLNGDGVPDVLLIGDEGAYVSFATESSFGPAIALETEHPWIAVRAADVNSDGMTDIVGVFDDNGDEKGGFEIILTAL